MDEFATNLMAVLIGHPCNALWCGLIRGIASAKIQADDLAGLTSPEGRDEDISTRIDELIEYWRQESLPDSVLVDINADSTLYYFRGVLTLTWDEIFDFGNRDACGSSVSDICWDLRVRANPCDQDTIDEVMVEAHFRDWRARFMNLALDAAERLVADQKD